MSTKKGSRRFAFRVTTSEVSGPSGAGSKASENRTYRSDSGIKLVTPKTRKKTEAAVNERDELIEVVSARLHVTIDILQDITLATGLSADTAAVNEAVDAILESGWLAKHDAEVREQIARKIQAASPSHMTRDYNAVDQAYDDAARIAREYVKDRAE